MYYIGIDLGGTNIAAEEKKVVMAQLSTCGNYRFGNACCIN